MNLSGLVAALFPVFFVVALGYAAGKRNAFDADQAAGFSVRHKSAGGTPGSGVRHWPLTLPALSQGLFSTRLPTMPGQSPRTSVLPVASRRAEDSRSQSFRRGIRAAMPTLFTGASEPVSANLF
jgi:hypothetical protein